VTVQVGGKDVNMPFVIGAGDPANKTASDRLHIVHRCHQAGDPGFTTRRRIYWYLDKHDN
jgi:hypothetical protein